MFLQIAELIALIGFLWAFAKMQIDQNHKFDQRLDELHTKITVLIEGEKRRSEYTLEQFERLEEKFNYLKARLFSDQLKPDDK